MGPWVSGEFGLVSGFSRKPSFVGVFSRKIFLCGAKQDFQELGGGRGVVAMVSSQEARSRNLRNAALAAIVPLPAILFYLSFLHLCPNGSNEEENQVLDQWGFRACKLGKNHPIVFLNIIVFFCFSVLFWIISLFQQSTWVRFLSRCPEYDA